MTAGSFRERNVDGVTILTVERVLKGTLEALLKERLDGLVREGRLQIVIDLAHVPYLDSSEIGRIIRAHLSVRQAGGRVRLCNLSERVLALMELTRLHTVLELYRTEEEALAAILQDTRSLRAAASDE